MTDEEDPAPKMWHRQQEMVLKQWGETCSCYRWLHYKSFSKFKKMSLNFQRPEILNINSIKLFDPSSENAVIHEVSSKMKKKSLLRPTIPTPSADPPSVPPVTELGAVTVEVEF